MHSCYYNRGGGEIATELPPYLFQPKEIACQNVNFSSLAYDQLWKKEGEVTTLLKEKNIYYLTTFARWNHQNGERDYGPLEFYFILFWGGGRSLAQHAGTILLAILSINNWSDWGRSGKLWFPSCSINRCNWVATVQLLFLFIIITITVHNENWIS